MDEYDELAQFARDVVQRCGLRIAELRASKTVEESLKDGGRELVTSADLASDELIREATQRHTPSAQYLSEEGDQADVDWARPVWVADPIDGTVNYVYGQSHVGISLAYVVGGEVQVGAVHSPFQAETFVGVRGHGVTANGVPLQAVATRKLANAVVATGFPHNHEQLDEILQRLWRVLHRCRDIRRLASPALDICWVALGRLDATYETLKPWDVAAAGLIAREAGVQRGFFGAEPQCPPEVFGEDVAFARPALLNELLEVLRGSK